MIRGIREPRFDCIFGHQQRGHLERTPEHRVANLFIIIKNEEEEEGQKLEDFRIIKLKMEM
jgi:hypothetical protein